MNSPKLSQLKATKIINQPEYNLSGIFNDSASQLTNVEVTPNTDTALEMSVPTLGTGIRFGFGPYEVDFENLSNDDNDMLDIITKYSSKSGKHGGIIIKNTKYPPPYNFTDLLTGAAENSSLSNIFTYDFLHLTRTSANPSKVLVSIQLAYELDNSGGKEFTANGAMVLMDDYYYYENKKRTALVLFVNEYAPNPIPDPNLENKLQFIKEVDIDNSVLGAGLPIIISNQNPATFEWQHITTKSALFSFEV